MLIEKESNSERNENYSNPSLNINSFGNSDLNNLKNINQSSEKVPLLSEIIKDYEPNENEIKESKTTSINLIDKLINETGFNNYFIINLMISGLFFLAEGSQIFINSCLNPVFKQIFDKKIYGEFLISFISSSFYFGLFIGIIICPYISKNFNRRIPIISSNFLIIFFSIVYVCWENIYWIIGTRILIGFFFGIGITLNFTNYSESIPSENREIWIFILHIFYRCGVFYIICLFNFIIPTFDVAFWKQFYLLALIPHVFIIIFGLLFLIESPKFLNYKKDIDATIKSLVEMNRFSRSNLIITEEHISDLRRLFHQENIIIKDSFNGYNVDSTKFESENFINIKLEEGKSLLQTDNKQDIKAEIDINDDRQFSLFKIFHKQYLLLTIISSLLYSIFGSISHSMLYYLPIVYFKISEQNKIKDFDNLADLSIQNKILTNEKYIDIHQTSLDKKYSLIFFVSQIVTIFGVILGMFVAKKLGRKYTVLLTIFPCLIVSIFCCYYQSMILPSASIINFFIVIPCMTIKLFIVEAYDTKMRDSGFGFGFFCKSMSDCLVPFIINSLIDHGILYPMYFISCISGIAILLALMISSSHDGMKIQ